MILNFITMCVCDKLRRIGRVVERARNFGRGGVGFDSRQSFSHPFLAYIELREAKNGDPQQCQCSPNCVWMASIACWDTQKATPDEILAKIMHMKVQRGGQSDKMTKNWPKFFVIFQGCQTLGLIFWPKMARMGKYLEGCRDNNAQKFVLRCQMGC